MVCRILALSFGLAAAPVLPAPAPPFRTLHLRYDVANLAEAFAEGIVVAHDGPRQMPQFMLSPAETDDLIAYLESLEIPLNQPDATIRPEEKSRSEANSP